MMDRKPPSSDFKKELDTYMADMRARNKLDIRGGFISLQFLKRLFTPENLKERLDSDFKLQPYELTELEEFIRTRAKLVYAILILIDTPQLIQKLKKCQPAVDDILLFKASEGDPRSFCKKASLKKIPELSDVLDSFYEAQWVFPPPVPATETLFFDAKFFKFPFITQPHGIGHGGSGQVHEVDIDGGFLNESEYFKPGVKVVYKKIKKEGQGKDGWETIMREVKTLRERQHRNITPLLASFTAGLEVPSNPLANTECLYLISPRASMDMDKWMQEEPCYLKGWNDRRLRLHIWDAMSELISGLTYIHREIGGNVGYHADLKPKNILLFDTGCEPRYVWKICDFGTANIKPIDDTRTKSFTTTRYWAPKEFFEEEYRIDGQNHGRAHDVWSLGCIFLLLATIVKYKWKSEGKSQFEDLRKKESEKGAFCASMKTVSEWIQKLKTGNHGTKLTKVVELIEEMLKPRTERIFSWEVEVDLHHIVDEEHDVLKHLGKVIQKARDVDRQMQHNPLARAKRKNREEAWLDILMYHDWYDEQTTEEQNRARIANRYISALPPLDKQTPIGTEILFESISKSFTTTSSVALHGVGGIGKSLVARHYVEQGIDWKEGKAIKHTFWIQAQNISLFKESYRDISNKLGSQDPKLTTEDRLYNSVKSQLENESMEPWFMVVDGLDHFHDAEFIEPLLPVRGSGYILITTRDRYMVRNLVEINLGGCLEVERPSEAACLEIFRRHIDKTLLDESLDHAKKLVNTVWSPDAIRRLADYMNRLRRTCETMCESIQADDGSFWRDVDRFLPNFADDLLKPALIAPLKMQDQWPKEVQLLFLLSLFDKECGIDFDLIRVEYEHAEVPRRMLEKLRTCSWVSEPMRRENGQTLYFVSPVIHLALLAWIEKNEGNPGFLRRYNKALSMMFRIYDKRKRTSKKDKPNKPSNSSIIRQLNLMEHFKHFVCFARRTSETFEFTLYDRAVQAIATFTNVFLDDGCHDDAIQILEFTRKHFKLKDLEAQDDENRLRHRDTYFEFSRRLVKAYLPRPKDDESRTFRTKAEDLINTLRQEAQSIGNTEQWTEGTLLEWKLSLDLIRISWESGNFSKGLQQLDKMACINVVVRDGDAYLPAYTGESHFQNKVEEEKFLQKRQRLAILVKQEEGLLNLRAGQDHKSKGNNLRKARKAWQAAQRALRDAQTAVKSWFPKDAQLHKNIDLYQAEADTMVETGKALDRPMSILTQHLEQLLEDNGNKNRRAWDVECKLNFGRLKRGGYHLDEAEKSLRQLLPRYEEFLGINDDKTLGCASLLREVYVKKGRMIDADGLSSTYMSLPVLEKSRWDSGAWQLWKSENKLWLLSTVIVLSIAVLANSVMKGGKRSAYL